MVRATSLASYNLQKSERVQSLVKDDVDSQSVCFGGIHRYTLRLPVDVACADIWDVMADLLDRTTQQHLERRGVLNWHPDFGRLVVMKMSGNGNCLLHAISTYMWGVQDSKLTLQKLLCRALTEPTTSRPLRKRFMEHLMGLGNARCQSSQEDMQRKWDAVVSMASSAPIQQADNDLLLRAIEIYMYIFTMAQILRRPIIVLAEYVPLGDGGPSLGGIYLPLQWPAEECVKNPIMLAYHSGQFFPLLSTLAPHQATSPVPIDAVPMIRQNGESLPVHLLLTEEAGHVQEYLNHLLDTVQVQHHHGNCLVAARLGSLTPPDEFNLFLDIFQQTGGGPNPAEAREASPGPVALENRNGGADQSTSVSCTQGAEGLTSQGADLDQQMLRMSIQKEVTHHNSHSHDLQVPLAERVMTSTANACTTDDNQHNLVQVHNMPPASQQNIHTSHSTNQDEGNNHNSTSSKLGGWQQNNVLPRDVSATAEGNQDGNHAPRANSRSSRTACDNTVQWDATGAKPKQYSSRSRDGSKKFGNPPARDKSICKMEGCGGIAVPRLGGICRDCYTRKSQKEREKRNKKRLSIENPSGEEPASQQREARSRKTSRSAGQEREQQTQSGQRSVSSAPTTSKNSSSAKERHETKEQKSTQPVNTSTSTKNTSGRSSATDNGTLMRPEVLGLQTTHKPEVPQSNDAGSLPETTFLPNSGPPSTIIYASSSGQSSATSTHGTDPSVNQMILNGRNHHAVNQLTNDKSTSRMQHNADGPLGPTLYHARTTVTAQHSTECAVPENHNSIPAHHLCTAPNCDRLVNKNISDFLCEDCYQVLGKRNQMRSVPDIDRVNHDEECPAVGRRDGSTRSDRAATVMSRNPKIPAKYSGKDSAVNPPMRNQQGVYMPSELRSAHQYPRSLLQHWGTGHHQTLPPPDRSTEQPATRPSVLGGCRYTDVMGESPSNNFDASRNISLHTDPESRSESASMPPSISCNNYNYYKFEPGSIQNFNNYSSPADNSTPKVYTHTSVPFPDPADACRSARPRARGSPSPQNGQTPLLRSSPSPPLPARQGPSTHMMYDQSLRNDPPPPPVNGFPSGQGYRQDPRTELQWNNLSACSNETKPLTQHLMQDPALRSNAIGPRNTPTPSVPIPTCNMPDCNHNGDPAYSGFCPQCFDWLNRNRRC